MKFSLRLFMGYRHRRIMPVRDFPTLNDAENRLFKRWVVRVDNAFQGFLLAQSALPHLHKGLPVSVYELERFEIAATWPRRDPYGLFTKPTPDDLALSERLSPCIEKALTEARAQIAFLSGLDRAIAQ